MLPFLSIYNFIRTKSVIFPLDQEQLIKKSSKKMYKPQILEKKKKPKVIEIEETDILNVKILKCASYLRK